MLVVVTLTAVDDDGRSIAGSTLQLGWTKKKPAPYPERASVTSVTVCYKMAVRPVSVIAVMVPGRMPAVPSVIVYGMVAPVVAVIVVGIYPRQA